MAGSLTIHVADMMHPGGADEDVLRGAYGLCHVAGNFGTDPRW